MTKRNNRGFTLVELLVVISIIAILAGLSFPAITGALKRARQTADVSNIRQIGTTMFTYASDNNFVYPDGDGAGEIFTIVAEGGYLTDYSILVASGHAGKTVSADDEILNTELSYGIMAPASDNSHSALPLLFSQNSGVGNIAAQPEALGEAETLTLGSDGVWSQDGITVYRKGNSAEFIKGGNDGVTAANKPWLPAGYKDGTGYTAHKPD